MAGLVEIEEELPRDARRSRPLHFRASGRRATLVYCAISQAYLSFDDGEHVEIPWPDLEANAELTPQS